MKTVIDGVTTIYVGKHYEKVGGVVNKYYYFGSQQVAVRKNGVVSYLFGDHLTSASASYNTGTGASVTQRYYAYGATRSGGGMPTARAFTNQIADPTTGLLFYNARYYDPALGRFIQADTIVPGAGNPQALNRYAYTLNNPLKYTDPSGHWPGFVDAAVTWASNQLTSVGRSSETGKALVVGMNDVVQHVNNQTQTIF